jgi:cellobiose phosphorylase
VYSLENQAGRGGWTWYTGSAGWMYRVWLEEVLGFKLRGNELSIQPSIPDSWPGYAITFRYGRTTYRIEVENGGVSNLPAIQLQDDGQEHHFRLTIGPSRIKTPPDVSTSTEIVT